MKASQWIKAAAFKLALVACFAAVWPAAGQQPPATATPAPVQPVAKLSVSCGKQGLQITANAGASTGPPTGYRFVFGDSSKNVDGAESSVKHTYQRAGTYLVTVRVSNTVGNDNAQKKVTVPCGRRDAERPKRSEAVPKPKVSTCRNLPAHISVTARSGLDSGIQCQQVAAGITGVAGALDAVDVWAWMDAGAVEAGATVCFAGAGSLMFLDAAQAPRVATDLSSYGAGRTCGDISGAGTVVLLPGMATVATATVTAIPARTAAVGAVTALQDCTVTATHMLNFRRAPWSGVMAIVSRGQSLPANGSAISAGDKWYRADWNERSGWVHGDYVALEGNCG